MAQRVARAYVVFGHPGPFSAKLDLTTVNGGNGFPIDRLRALTTVPDMSCGVLGISMATEFRISLLVALSEGSVFFGLDTGTFPAVISLSSVGNG